MSTNPTRDCSPDERRKTFRCRRCRQEVKLAVRDPLPDGWRPVSARQWGGATDWTRVRVEYECADCAPKLRVVKTRLPRAVGVCRTCGEPCARTYCGKACALVGDVALVPYQRRMPT